MEWITSPEIWIALFTLTALEIVLGIDNVIFISILAGKLPEEQREKARRVGLSLAMGIRILLLLSISWIVTLEDTLFSVFDQDLSGKDLIMLGGGLFLLAKATWELHEKLEGHEGHAAVRTAASFASVIVQILLLDIVFSIDSVITAVGMADDIGVMIAAVVIAVGVMLVSAGAVGNFVDQHPTVKVLALSFLLLIGMSLVAEGFDTHIPKGYIYFAMAFSVIVELLNLRLRKVSQPPITLRDGYHVTDPTAPAGFRVATAPAAPGKVTPQAAAAGAARKRRNKR